MATYKTVSLRPTSVEVSYDAVVISRPKIVGEDTTTIPLDRVASVDVRTGLVMWRARVVVHTADDEFVIEGLRNGDAKAIRDDIETARSR